MTSDPTHVQLLLPQDESKASTVSYEAGTRRWSYYQVIKVFIYFEWHLFAKVGQSIDSLGKNITAMIIILISELQVQLINGNCTVTVYCSDK